MLNGEKHNLPSTLHDDVGRHIGSCHNHLCYVCLAMLLGSSMLCSCIKQFQNVIKSGSAFIFVEDYSLFFFSR